MLDTYASDVSLPLQAIHNANPAWIRDDLGDLTGLVKHIRKQGLVLPVLVTPDAYVIDGARRIEALQQLGVTAIPVVTVDTWEQVVDYFVKARQLESLGLPFKSLKVMEFGALVNGPLYQLMKHAAGQRANKTKALRKQGVQVPKASSKQTTETLAKMFGMTQSEVIVRRDIWSKTNTCRRLGLGEEALALVLDIEGQGGRLYSIQAALADMANGRPVTRRRFFPGQPTVSPSNITVDRNAVADPQLATEQARRIEKLIFQLGLIGEEIQNLGNLNPAIEPDVADRLAKQYRAAVRRVTPLRLKLLEMTSAGMQTEEGNA